MLRRYELTDDEWNRIVDLLPPENTGKQGRPRKDNRTIVNGMVWIAHSGAPWRRPARALWPMGDCLQPLPQMDRGWHPG